METLREEAIELVKNLPEKYLPSVIGLMESLNYLPEDDPPAPKKKLDLTQYMNHGKRMFKDANEVDEFIKETRRERF